MKGGIGLLVGLSKAAAKPKPGKPESGLSGADMMAGKALAKAIASKDYAAITRAIAQCCAVAEPEEE